MANVGGVRERARDAQRKNDINQIQKALEMYKNSQKPPAYPDSGIEDLSEALTEGDFMKKVPHDPKCTYIEDDDIWECGDWPDYDYDLDDEDSLKYTIVACLENASDQQKDLTNTCSTGYSFTRTDP